MQADNKEIEMEYENITSKHVRIGIWSIYQDIPRIWENDWKRRARESEEQIKYYNWWMIASNGSGICIKEIKLKNQLNLHSKD
jgi:hypothetical protein